MTKEIFGVAGGDGDELIRVVEAEKTGVIRINHQEVRLSATSLRWFARRLNAVALKLERKR